VDEGTTAYFTLPERLRSDRPQAVSSEGD
jgi:hypothetical protein